VKEKWKEHEGYNVPTTHWVDLHAVIDVVAERVRKLLAAFHNYV